MVLKLSFEKAIFLSVFFGFAFLLAAFDGMYVVGYMLAYILGFIALALLDELDKKKK